MRNSILDLPWKKKESENFEILTGQLRFYSLTNRKKKKKTEPQRCGEALKYINKGIMGVPEGKEK